MVAIKLEENQNLFDAAVQEFGSIEGLFEVLESNDITNITSASEDNISVYNDLKIQGDFVERDVVEYYVAREKKPATALTNQDIKLSVIPEEFHNKGIGCMTIEDDFIVHTPSQAKPITCIEKVIYDKMGSGIGFMTVGGDNIVR
ncbi:hypothetical protein [Tenacibaculum sp. 190524A05c]|uniref:hypothetical protein n=1 Tax=Tenacibaculum platacis TaxID=3137852 RepID=UPI0032B190DE